MNAPTTFGCPCHTGLSHRFLRSAACSRSRGCCVPRRAAGAPRSGRADGLRVARLRHGGDRPLPARVGRLRRHHRPRQRGRPHDAARPRAPARRLAGAPRRPLPSPRRLRRPRRLGGLGVARNELRPRRPNHGRASAWHPEDGLFVQLRHADGHLLGIVSVDEPANGKRPTDGGLDVLVALGDHAALAVQAATRPPSPPATGARSKRSSPSPRGSRAQSRPTRSSRACAPGSTPPSASRTSAWRSSTRSPARSSRTPRSAGASTIRRSRGRSR